LAKISKLLEIPKDKFPKHVFIIPDGNGRWAKAHRVMLQQDTKKDSSCGKTLEDLAFFTIEVVTIWGFSTDNWKRSREEVNGLMFIFTQMIGKVLNKLKKRNGRFMHIAEKTAPKGLLQASKKQKRRQGNKDRLL